MIELTKQQRNFLEYVINNHIGSNLYYYTDGLIKNTIDEAEYNRKFKEIQSWRIVDEWLVVRLTNLREKVICFHDKY
jgi:hypothetical protein